MLTEKDKPSISRWAILVITTIATILTPLAMAMVNVALPAIGKEFPASAATLSWIMMVYTLSTATFLLPFGKIADIYGRKIVFLVGISIFTFSCLTITFSSNLTALIILRAIQGLGAGMIFGTSLAILTTAFPIEKRGRVLGINTAAAYLGLSLGPFLGGVLTQHFGWRSIFLINVFLGFVIIALGLWKLGEEQIEAGKGKIDYRGILMYCPAVLCVMYGFATLPGLPGMFLILFGAVGLVLFIRWEMGAANPILDISLFRHNKVFAFSNVAHLINYAATTAVVLLLSFYFQYIRGFSPQKTGFILMAQPIIQTLLSPVAGRLSDKVEPWLLSSAGMILTTIGLFSFAFLQKHTSLSCIVLNLIALGVGFALFSSPNSNAIMGAVEKRSYGAASSILGTMRLIGQMFSVGIAVLIFSLYAGSKEISTAMYDDLFKGIRTAFVIFGVLCAGGVFASLARGGKKGGGNKDKGQVPIETIR